MTTGLLIAVVIAFGAYIYKFPPKKSTLTPIPNPNKICMDYSANPMSELAVDLIHTMVDKYKGEQLKCINSHNSSQIKNDAQSIWFDLETLKKFVYHIEKVSINKAKEKGLPEISSKRLGIRIYYAAYPNKENWNQFEDLVLFRGQDPDSKVKDYGDLHTLVMIPTLEIRGNMADFNPLDHETYTHGIYDWNGYAYNYGTTRMAALSLKTEKNDDGSTGSQNHGGLIPPADPANICGF